MASTAVAKFSAVIKSTTWHLWNKQCWNSSLHRMNQHSTLLDPTQISFLKEPCIAVSNNDQVLRSITKEEAHLLGPHGELPPLHRAFSVFLFNTKNELLMQQRSNHKITFPGI